MPVSFIKMHGNGNDFVIIDSRHQDVPLSDDAVRAIAARRTGVGCDQLIIIEESKKADCSMRIYNADGSEVSACGNATRCVGWLMMNISGLAAATIETQAGLLVCHQAEGQSVRVNMGQPIFDWQKIPLNKACDVLNLEIELPLANGTGEVSRPSEPSAHLMGFSGENPGGKISGAAASMGNPHLIFVVPDVAAVDLDVIGPQLETHPLFPEKTNVSFVQIESKASIIQRVWERGSGQTLACGTAACASVAALHKRGELAATVDVALPGGMLLIEYDTAADEIYMTGEVAVSFRGELAL